MTAKTIGVKYCGGCNPQIDRSGLVEEIRRRLPPEFRLGTDRPEQPREKALLVCGCPIACADRPEVRRLARRWIRIGGATVDRESVPAEKMAEVVIGKILAPEGENTP
jgi:3-hydroxyacyl-[acyl-carrier-protein] dehydratase